MVWRRRRQIDSEIAPEDIFLDASNIAALDHARLEGRLEKPISSTTFAAVLASLGILFVILSVRAWHLQIVEGADFARTSADNSLEVTTVFAPRGVMLDTHGVAVAENVVRDDGSIGRRYPFVSMSQVTGYVSYPKKDSKGIYYDTEQTGISGLEAQYDAVLKGKNGQILTERDALGNIRTQGSLIPPIEGKSLTLSIDVALQEALAQAVEDTAKNVRFAAGSGVIMDVEGGAVRALVSYPSFDANVMASGGPAATIALYNTNQGHPFLDHAVQGVYVPGSIVKPLIAAGALTDGVITPAYTITDTGSITIDDPYNPGKTYVYTGWKPLGIVDVKKAIAWSSDIYFYIIGGGYKSQKGLGIDRLEYWYRQFGLGTTTGIDLGGEAAGRVPNPAWKKATFNEPWYLGDTYFTAIGQYAVQVTPIQMARATAALANGGKLYTPTLVEQNGQQPFTSVPVDARSLAIAREGMRMAVTEAIAGAINLPYVSVAAKTGTAQTGTRNQFNNSWVVGFFPYEHPKYVFVVVLERGPAGSGSQAVNVMRQFFDTLHAQNSPYVGGIESSTAP